MSSPRITTSRELFDYVIANGPPMVQSLRDSKVFGRREVADDLWVYFLDMLKKYSYKELEPVMKVVRDNIILVAGDEADFELADIVGAPWDCFA